MAGMFLVKNSTNHIDSSQLHKSEDVGHQKKPSG